MLATRCFYFPRGLPADEIAATLERFFRGTWDPLLDGRIDGANLSANLFVAKGGIQWTPASGGAPKRIWIPLLDENRTPSIRRKGTSPDKMYGLEFYVDPSSGTYGRVCIVDGNDPSNVQRLSFLIDAYTASSPGAEIRTPTGALTFDTGAASDVIMKRNGTEIARLDGTFLVTPNIVWKSGTDYKGTLDHAISADRTYTFPDAAVNVAGSASALTNLRVPKGSATSGVIQDSLIADSGTVPSYNGNTIWHAGNDGAGSGLDADLLDGLSSADFSLVTPVDSTFRVVGSADATKKLAFEVDGFTTGTTRTKTPTNRDGTLHDSGGQNTWATGLGAITQIIGPTDQELYVKAASGRAVYMQVEGLDGGIGVDSSGGLVALGNFTRDESTFTIGVTGGAWAEVYTPIVDSGSATDLILQRNNVTGLTLAASKATTPFQIESTLATGTKPLAVSSTTLCDNLNADLLDGSDGTAYQLIVGKSADKALQTASNGGSYSVAATVSIVFVDASALTAAQNYTINLPSPVTYPGRQITVKISVVGAATSTVTIDSDAGNVEGSATQAFSASIRSGATFLSNGTDWYIVGQYGIA